jgi:hypothetical protein
MAITVVSAASSTKLTTKESLKALLGISTTTDDTLMDNIIDRVSAQIVRFCNRDFAKQTVDETMPSDGGRNLITSRFPLVSITSITYDGDTVAAADYSLQEPNSGFIFNEDGWTYTQGVYLYTVRYVYGYILPSMLGTRDLPFDIEQAALIAAKAAYVSRARDPQVRKEYVPDVYSVTYADVAQGGDASGLPSDATALLAPYRNYRV